MAVSVALLLELGVILTVLPILGILTNGYMMYKLGWVNWLRLIVWLAIGLIIYFMYSKHHSRLQNGGVNRDVIDSKVAD